MRTPTPPKLNFDASMEFLEKRHVSDSLAEINANEFKPKTFSTASNSKGEKSDADVLKVKGELKSIKLDSNDDPLFHQKVTLNIYKLNLFEKINEFVFHLGFW